MANKKIMTTSKTNDLTPEEWPGIDSKFRLINLAALRAKQLLRGAQPRIGADPLKRKNTSIALEELKRGLVTFTPAELE
jgi:DNA-directed RNA polymerase omega subunit